MRVRLLGLLVIAAACAWLATAVAATRPEEAPAALPAAPPLQRSTRACPLPRSVRPAFQRAARDTGVPLALLVAVARADSRRARPGLDLDYPPSNVLAAARYLRLMLDRFHSTDLALAAYEAGPTAVAKAGGAPSGETLAYVATVTRVWRRLRGCK
jgi:soluble lytic murein transglycosylase-like protein